MPQVSLPEIYPSANHQDMEIKHPFHVHPLLIQPDKRPNPEFECRGCSRPYDAAGPIYGCVGCNFYLHKSCAELPREFQSPLHPPHSLGLLYGSDPSSLEACSCCRRNISGKICYVCGECGYMLDLECAALTPLLKLRDPVHLLCLLEKVGFADGSCCGKCGEGFGVADATSPVFVCLIPECSHALHFHCAPLSFPETAPRHYFHNYHDLIYIPEPALEPEGDHQHSGDERYCDVCEETRNPKSPIYCCKECDYKAHVYCAVSEVLPSLVEKYENVYIERNVCLDAFLHYYEGQVSRWRSQKEFDEAKLLEMGKELKALEDELARCNMSSS